MNAKMEKPLSKKEDLLNYIESLTPEQIEKINFKVPRLIAELEKLGQPVPPIASTQIPYMEAICRLLWMCKDPDILDLVFRILCKSTEV